MSRTSAVTPTFAIHLRRLGAALLFAALAAGFACAQQTAAVPHAVVPNLVQFNGAVTETHPGKAEVVFALYKDQADRVALWQETQSVTIDAAGRYAVLLGAGSADGIPAEVFSGGAARWLGVTVDGQAEQPRVLLTSVPYAMKASDAETLGGLPASAFLRETDPLATGTASVPVSNPAPAFSKAAKANTAAITATGAKTGYLPVFSDAAGDLGSSLIAETSKNVGIGIAEPANSLSVAGIIQSTTGGFKFPDGTTQTTAVALPVTWKGAAKAPAGVLNVTDTTTGPISTKGSTPNFSLLPSAIVGTASGGGTTAGVVGQATSTASNALGIGVLGTATGSQGIAVMGYSSDPGDMPAIVAWSAATSGTPAGFDAELNSPGATGYRVNFNATPTTGMIFQANVNTSDATHFSIDGRANINTTGGLSVQGPTVLSGGIRNGLTVNGNLTVTGKINGADSQFTNDHPLISASGAKTGYIPVFSDTTGDLTPSLIAETSKYVGIGTATPANPLTVAGIVQSTTGGFKFPDGTTQTTAVALPVNWKSTAQAGTGVLEVTNTTNGPSISQSSTSFPAMPAAILGTASGHGTAIGVLGQATGNGSGDLGIGVMGRATTQGVGIVGYNNSTGYPTIVSWNGPNSGNATGGTNAFEGDLFNPRDDGLVIKFNVTPTTGHLIEAGIPGPGGKMNGSTMFVVDGNASIRTSGGLSVTGPTSLGGGITGGLTVNNGMTVNNGITVSNGTNTANTALTVDNSLQVDGNVGIHGNLSVWGTVSKGGGNFKIDHPLDPANKYLYHSFVESPDMMNIYNGNVVTDSNGIATVELPSYFEALNQDFRYQLTVIGQFAQAIVAKEIVGNRFTIQTSKPAVKVSWQVTGIRHDAYAEAHRVVVEEEKPAAERGTYLHPELFTNAPEVADGK